jgi:hypothetical protein
VAWTVTRQADGTIQISRSGQMGDPAGLQRTLRADGVPASVTFIGQQNQACQLIPPQPIGKPPLVARVMHGGDMHGHFFIHPSALPAVDGLQIAIAHGMASDPLGPGPWPYGNPNGSGKPALISDLVKASPQCTGS